MREARGLSIEELADRSGLSWRGVVYIEHGQRNASLTTILDLARGLAVAPAELLTVFEVPVEAGDDPRAAPPAGPG